MKKRVEEQTKNLEGETEVDKVEQEIMRKLKMNHRFSEAEVKLALSGKGTLADVMSQVHVPAKYF